MKIMIDFNGGGPLDGSHFLDRELEFKAGEPMTFREFVVLSMGVTSGFRFNIGHRFSVPSPGWFDRTVHRPQQGQHSSGDFPRFEYVITQREAANDELLLVAQFIGQMPTAEKAPPEKAGGEGKESKG